MKAKDRQPTLLLIETATKLCSVALSHGTEFLFRTPDETDPQGRHAELLAPYIETALQTVREKELQLDAVAIGCGPGSYTGLRIGASLAKGLAFGMRIPLIAVPTLETLAAAALCDCPEVAYCDSIRPMIDARRMEVYTAAYNKLLNLESPTEAVSVDARSFAVDLEKGPILFVGDGVDKCRDVLQHPRAVLANQAKYPYAAAMLHGATQRFEADNFANTAYWEPDYLKAYEAVRSVNKVLSKLI